MLQTADIPDVEICAPGIWNGVELTAEDLEGIARASAETAALVPPRVRLGHDMRQRFAAAIMGAEIEPGEDGLPALGRPENVRFVNGRLVSTLARVPEKIVDLCKTGAYVGRSVGLRRNVTVNGKTYPWLLDHVALLGEDRPAVDGLREMFLSADDKCVVLLSGIDTEGKPITLGGMGVDTSQPVTPEALAEQQVDLQLEQINEQLAALQQKASELTRGKRGNPVITNLFRALREGITRVVGAQLSGESLMADTLDLMGEMPGGQPPGDPGAPAAGALSISTPEVLAAMLAAKLGKGPEDFTAIYQAAVALIDAGREAKGEPDPLTTPAAPMEGANMSDPTPTTDFAAALAAQQEELNQTKAALAALQVQNHQAAAELRVDRDIEAHSLPATVRGALIDLALAGKDELYQNVIDGAQRVPTTERGVNLSGADAGSVVLTPEEMAFCARTGLDPEKFKAQKLADSKAGR